MTFYTGNKLLNTLDLDGLKPEIFMATGNRSSGKTTFFNKLLVDEFIQKGEQFCLLYRFSYELQNAHSAFFDDIKGLFFPEYNMTSLSFCRGLYRELYLNNQLCGFAVALNCADTVKRNSHIFTNVKKILMDEFQSETNKYCDDEITKFISIHKSMARGHGKQTRYLPVYMVSNCVSLLNPYFSELGVTDRLKPNTKILRGHGWVVEQNFNQSASLALKESRFLKAFEGRKEVAYMTENAYLNDNNHFVEKIPGKMRYFATIVHNDQYFNISYSNSEGVFYTSPGYDKTFPIIVAANRNSHNMTTTYAPSSVLVQTLRQAFHAGRFRFKNLPSKKATMELIHY